MFGRFSWAPLGMVLSCLRSGAHGGARLADAEVTVGGFRDDSAVMLVTPYDEVEEVWEEALRNEVGGSSLNPVLDAHQDVSPGGRVFC